MSDGEKDFLDQNLDNMTDEALADRLDRTVSFVSNYRKVQPHKMTTEAEDEIVVKMYNLYFWNEIKQQLTTEELKSFEYRWVVLHQQFQDVLPTDQMQIKDLIVLEILINRVLVEKQKTLTTISRIERQIKTEEDKPEEDRDLSFILNLETQLNAAMASQNARTTEHMKLQEKKDGKFKDLKATRDQRFKQLEDSRTSFFDLMKTLDSLGSREEEGRHMELMRLASEKSTEDLSQYTEYDDGTVDQPILNYKTATQPEDSDEG
ncbi:hypothetical protein CL634_05010 [bacterium]|nr:hypothetical protein [bacterium]